MLNSELNFYKIEVMITSVIEVLQLRNFGHMTTSTVERQSHDKVLLMTLWEEIKTSLKKSRVGSFADIIKIVTMLIKNIFKD